MEQYHFPGPDARDHCVKLPSVGPPGCAGAGGSPGGQPDGQDSENPPYTDRGVGIPAPCQNRSLLDWVGFTLKVDDPHEALNITGLSPTLFFECKKGFSGYKKSLRFGNISVYFQGREDMGCHVEMTGQGCRQYEAQFPDNPWLNLFTRALSEQANFTRLDLAIDTVDGSLPLESVWSAVQDHDIQVRSRFGEWSRYLSGSFRQGKKTTGETLYLGSKSSHVMFRIYNKAQESGIDSSWIRFEVQLRDTRAHEAAKLFVTGIDVGNLAVGIINNYFAIINSDDSNVSRCTLQSWWQNWLTSTEKITLTTDKAVKLVSDSMEFIKRQYAPSLAMINKHLGAAPFKEFVKEVLEDGFERMGAKHEQILAASAASGGDKP